MPPGPPLELNSVEANHPSVSILYSFAVSTIFRLSIDPTLLPSGIMTRCVTVEWVSQPGGSAPEVFTRDIEWVQVPKHFIDECVKLPITRNKEDISEGAAICVMALFLHELAGAEILTVLQIGSGGDYLIEIRGQPPLQAESSGIRRDPNGYVSTVRLVQKCSQVLSKSDNGFASVVAFSHPPDQSVRCQLHYVSRTGSGSNYPKVKKRRSRKPE